MLRRLAKAKQKIGPAMREKFVRISGPALFLTPIGILFTLATADAHHIRHRWYVSAAAPAGGDGSASAPFNSLALVQQASGPGDTIVIEPSPASTPPLDGGIALQPGQRLIGDGPPVVQFGAALIPNGPPVVGSSGNSSLPRITNTTNGTNSGDAVELASDTDVENLVIAGAYRGAIYGRDAVGVRLRGNDISGFNTSGTTGFVVQPFYLESYTAGVANDVANGLPAGWAAILIDTANVSTSLSISNNYIHDGVCGDGIDIRGMNTGDISAEVDTNFVTRLVQCSSVRTIEGIGTQVTGSSRLRATLLGNTEAYTGSAGANMDSLFVNPAEAGTLIETIDHNVYTTGIGGASTNGLEFILSNGSANSTVTVSNSWFQNNPGDMLEEFNRGGNGSTATLILDHVVVDQTTYTGGIPSYADPPGDATTPDNTGECLGIGSVGANDTTVLEMIDSSFTGCDNNGIEVTNNHPSGDGSGNPHTIVLDINNSTISGSRYYNLWLNDLTPLTNLRVRVQDSDLSLSSSGVAVAFDMQPTGATANALIDLGGGALGSNGRNCIFGGAIYDLEARGYNVFAQNNWWGKPGGPPAGKVIETEAGYTINDSSPLKHAPLTCR